MPTSCFLHNIYKPFIWSSDILTFLKEMLLYCLLMPPKSVGGVCYKFAFVRNISCPIFATFRDQISRARADSKFQP